MWSLAPSIDFSKSTVVAYLNCWPEDLLLLILPFGALCCHFRAWYGVVTQGGLNFGLTKCSRWQYSRLWQRRERQRALWSASEGISLMDTWVKTLWSLRGKEHVHACILSQILAVLFRSLVVGHLSGHFNDLWCQVGLSACFVDGYISGMETVWVGLWSKEW